MAKKTSDAALEKNPPTWKLKRVRLGDLTPWQRNPRKINAQQAARLVDSFESFGQVELLALGPKLEVYNGHQRLKVLRDTYGADHEVEARVSSRELTEKEREKLTIYLHRGAAGDFDFDMLLKEFDPIELDEWGLPDLNVPDVAEDEWQGMPEFVGNAGADVDGFHKMLVRFKSLEDLQAFAELVQQTITTNTKSIWYPAQPPRDLTTEEWATTEDAQQ